LFRERKTRNEYIIVSNAWLQVIYNQTDMKIKGIISILSLLANIYYHGLWLFTYQNYPDQESRVNAFFKLLPLPLSIPNTSILLLIMSVLSIWTVQALQMKNAARGTYILLQGVFIGMFVWQLL
jgi:hypothetical protein